MADETLMHSLRGSAGRVVFERFHLVRELGAGGMAVVWLARDERLGMEVALKFLPGMVASDPEALHDLRREITRGLKITHPGIVRVYDLHEDSGEGLAAIAMEYIDGATLAEEKGRQPERCFEAAEPLMSWLRALCDALSYVHEKARVVHRDLKPRNLMVTAEGELKITDFGIAATLCDSHSRVTQNPGSSGTPVYMSPQQAAGQNPRAADDIYALGATIYELLTSKPPFFRGAMPMILNQVATSIPPSMRERREELGISGRAPIPPEWEETVARCLAKDPEKRPASVREVASGLRLREEAPAAAADEEQTMQATMTTGRPGLSASVAPPPLPPRPPSPPPAPPPLEPSKRELKPDEESKRRQTAAGTFSPPPPPILRQAPTPKTPASKRPRNRVMSIVIALCVLVALGVAAVAIWAGSELLRHPDRYGLAEPSPTGQYPLLATPQPPPDIPMLPPSPAKMNGQTAWPMPGAPLNRLNDSAMKEIDCEVGRSFVEGRLGAPQHVSAAVQQKIARLGLNLQYCRYESPNYEMQILYSDKETVTAYTVRVDNAYFQKLRPDQSSMCWILGQSTLANLDQMAGPMTRPSWVTGGSNYVSYIEKYYFGKPGMYCDYYFCCSAPYAISTPQAFAYTKMSRSLLRPYAVLAAVPPKSAMTNSETQAWEAFLVQMLAVPGRGFEE